jgi:predicted DNA-binding protein (UPF0251 family)
MKNRRDLDYRKMIWKNHLVNHGGVALEGYNVHVAAHQVPDLEEHIDKLAMELEEWSLVNLKEWRQQQFGENMNVDSPTKQRPSKEAVRKQKAAKHNLMRALMHHKTSYEATEE